MLLELKNTEVYYDQVAALRGVSLHVAEGSIATLIGANGAGKSTTLRTISGLVTLKSGEILFEDKRIDRLPPDQIVKKGIAHVPEGRRVFPELSVNENLRLGAFTRKDSAGITQDLHNIFEYFPRLLERRDQKGNTLSGGEQQMVSIGRALMSRPKLLLLDEPSLGLAPLIVREIAKILLEINKKGVSIILVEQNAELALEVSQYGYVLERGNVTLEGEAESLMNNEHVKKAYLGI